MSLLKTSIRLMLWVFFKVDLLVCSGRGLNWVNCQVVSLPVLCGELLEGDHLHCGGPVLVDQVSELSWVRGHPHQGFRGWVARLLPLTVEEDDLVGDGIHAEPHVAALLVHFVERNWRRSISIEATISLSEYQLVLQEQTPAKVSFISFNLPY